MQRLEKEVFSRTKVSFRKLQKYGFKEEDGIGVVEIILIIVVLIGLVLIFKKQLTSIVNDIFSTITDKAGSV